MKRSKKKQKIEKEKGEMKENIKKASGNPLGPGLEASPRPKIAPSRTVTLSPLYFSLIGGPKWQSHIIVFFPASITHRNSSAQ
jgi:hypothetical protein